MRRGEAATARNAINLFVSFYTSSYFMMSDEVERP